jgi:PAP2 superfamily
MGAEKRVAISPPAPYRLSSEQYARDLNEVQSIGGKKSSKRSDEQTTIAKFWEFTGPGTYSPIARKWATEAKIDLVESARLFALFAMATADAYLAVFDAKYEYNFWRPITAIRNGADDGNRNTEADRSWLPLIDTPMHPEYPCAHCIASTTAANVLMKIFKSSKFAEIELTSPFAPNVTRRFSDLNDYVSEIVDARVLGGVHFRQSALVGKKMGEQVAEFVTNSFLTPR